MKTIITTALLAFASVSYAKTHYIYVTETFEFTPHHVQNLKDIRAAEPGDTLEIIINSPGGDVSVLNEYIDAIESDPVHVITRVNDFAASAAAVLMCFGQEIIIKPKALVVFHMVYSIDKDGNKTRASNNVRQEWLSLMKSRCGNLIAPDEYRRMEFEDEDIILPGAAINQRQGILAGAYKVN